LERCKRREDGNREEVGVSPRPHDDGDDVKGGLIGREVVMGEERFVDPSWMMMVKAKEKKRDAMQMLWVFVRWIVVERYSRG
jgi:hypothetical protein